MKLGFYIIISLALLIIVVGQANSQQIKVPKQRFARPASRLASKAVYKPITRRVSKPAPRPIPKPLPTPVNDFDDKHPDYHLHLPGKRDVGSFENYED